MQTETTNKITNEQKDQALKINKTEMASNYKGSLTNEKNILNS